MKLIGKIAVFLIFGLGCGFGQCIVDQFVNNLPIADINGVYWTIYDLTDPENRVVIEADPSCMTSSVAGGILWTAELGYWSPPPAVGDSLIIIGSWDSAYVNNPGTYSENQNHTGFYWLYSDIVDDVALTHWEDDTLRPMPEPIAAQVGADIEISITNPQETRYSGQTAYDVLGYWLWADTTGSGTPSKFDKEVAFVAVQGTAGETTIYSHPIAGNYENSQTVYWAYYLVARPDTGGGVCPGYSNHYLSANSNPLVIIGIEEKTHLTNLYAQRLYLKIHPNPFSEKTDIIFDIGHPDRRTHSSYGTGSAERINLKIYDVTGRIVKDFSCPTPYAHRSTPISWDGTDGFGKKLPAGIYFLQLESEGFKQTQKVILLH